MPRRLLPEARDRSPSAGRRRPSSARSRRGAAILEVLAALSLLGTGLLAALSVTVTSMDSDRVHRESSRALDAARVIATRVRDEPLDRIARVFDADPSNDPGGPGTAPGGTIQLPALGGTGTATCEVLLPMDGAGRLREDLDVPELGMPRDLNGDDVVDSADRGADALVLPYAVRVRWTGALGDREVILRGERLR